MSMASVLPISQLGRRLAEHGRIKTGIFDKSRGAPKAIGSFRLWSQDAPAIARIADLYGGSPIVATDGYGHQVHEVTTTSARLRVVLGPDPLAGTPIYEMWSKRGCQRRCDGITCQVQTPAGHPDPWNEVDCICGVEGKLSCTPKLRLNVILPDVTMAGTWRLETSSEYACREMPGMVELIRTVQSQGLVGAWLGLTLRARMTNQGRRNFIVPVLYPDASLDELQAGRGVPALNAGPATSSVLAAPIEAVEPDDFYDHPEISEATVIADAEIVDEFPTDAGDPENVKRDLRMKIAIILAGHGGDPMRHALARYVSGGRTDSTRQLSLAELERLLRGARQIHAGLAVTLDADGNARFPKEAP